MFDSFPLDPAILKALFGERGQGLLLLEDGKVREANAEAVELLARPKDELSGLPLADLLTDGNDALLEGGDEKEAGESVVGLRQGNGETISVSISVSGLDSDGKHHLVRLVPDENGESCSPSELAESALLKFVLDSIPIGVFWKDRDLRFQGCNRHFARHAGFDSPSEIVGKTDFEMPWDREDSEAYMRDDTQVMEANAPRLKIAERQLRSDGKHAWVETNKVPMHNGDGEVIGILGSYEDITERKNAEASLQEFSDGLHLVTQATSDKAGQEFFDHCVQALAELSGFETAFIAIADSAEDLKLKPKAFWHQGRLHESDAIDLTDSPLEEAARTKGMVLIGEDVTEYHPDNDFLRQHQVQAFLALPISHAQSDICGYFCAFDSQPLQRSLDPAKPIIKLFGGRIGIELGRVWATEELERKIASARLLERISAQVRASFDPDEIVQSAVERLGEGLGIDRCMLLSYHQTPKPELLLTAEHSEAGVEAIDEWTVKVDGDLFFEGLLASEELVLVDRVDESPMLGEALVERLVGWQVESIVAVPTSYQNQPNGVLILQCCGSKDDWPSDEKDLIKAVADMLGIALGQARMFEQERLQRHELARKNRALAKAKSDADSANHAKSEFLARMSHELRTPLNAILGFAQVMARDTMATEQQRQNLGTITRSGTHLLEMINDVLEMSRIEAGEVSMEPASFNLEDLVDSVVSMFQTRAHPGVKLKLGIAPTVPDYARTDEVKLRQILINLFGNAVKFTKEGEIALRIRAEQRYPDGISSAWNLIASVHDTGPGIHPDEAGAIFNPFSQTESGQRIQQGTGLGLPISRQFARLLGGDITVQSRLGEGTVFTLTIPCEEADPAELNDRRLSQSQRARGLANGQEPPNVMIVDDHQESRAWLEMLLSSIGLPAKTAANGAEALKLYGEKKPDVVFMDIHMPVMDGDTAAAKMRAEKDGEAPLLVALTASAFVGEHDRVDQGPFDLFLAKPVHEKSLVDVFESRLGVAFDYGEEAIDDDQWYQTARMEEPGSNDLRQEELVLQPLETEPKPEIIEPAPEPKPAEPEQVEANEEPASPLTHAICEMDESWLGRMEQASACLNLKETRELITALGEAHPGAAKQLLGWCEDYQFEKLQSELQLARDHRHATR